MLERGYEAVTVNDVAERANVGRSTLYAHFGGLDGMLKESMTNPSQPLAALVDRSLTPQQLAPLFEHFKDQRKRNRVFFAPPLRGLWVRRLAELIEPRLAGLAQDGGLGPPPLPLSFVATQVADSQIALVANWLSQGAGAPSETVAAAMIAMTRAMVGALAPCAEAGD